MLAFLRAPVVYDEQLTDEQRAEEAAAMTAGTAGSVSHAEVMAMIREMAVAEGAGAEFDARIAKWFETAGKVTT